MVRKKKQLDMEYESIFVVIFSARLCSVFENITHLNIKTSMGSLFVSLSNCNEIKLFIRTDYKDPVSVSFVQKKIIVKKHVETVEYPNVQALMLDCDHFVHSKTQEKTLIKLPCSMTIPIFTAENYLSNIKLAFKSSFFNIFTSLFLNTYQSEKIFVKTIDGQVVEEKMPMYLKIFLIYIYNESLSNSSFYKGLCRKMTTRASKLYFSDKSVKYIKKFINFFNIDMSEVKKEKYLCFNDFFCRKLNKNARKVENKRALCSPSDCRIMAFDDVNESTKFWIKGQKFCLNVLLCGIQDLEDATYDLHAKQNNCTPAADYTQEISDLSETNKHIQISRKYSCDCHKNCVLYSSKILPNLNINTLIVCRLAAQDYHRFHSPVKGRIRKIIKIDGELLTVNPISVKRTNVFTENKRVVILIDSSSFGIIYLVAIGATIVGSIKLSVCEGMEVDMMQELGYFQIGGSTLVILSERKLRLRKEICFNSSVQIETYVNVGNALAYNINDGVS